MRTTMLLACMLTHLAAHAQTAISDEVPQWLLKTNLTTLLNIFHPSAVVGVDYRFAPAWAAELGIGTYLGGSVFATERGETYQGRRGYAALRYYYKRRTARYSYVGLEVRGSHAVNERRYLLSRQGDAYTEVMLLDREVNTRSISPKIGKLFYVGGTQRLLFDLYAGIGVRYSRVGIGAIPPDATIVPPGEDIFNVNVDFPEGLQKRPIIVAGVNLVYRLK